MRGPPECLQPRNRSSGHRRAAVAALILFAGGAADAASLAAQDGTAAAGAAPAVRTVRVVAQPLAAERTYIGTTAAAKAVDLRAQVTGYLVDRPFIEGSVVPAGATLFVIDPRPFQAIVEQRQAELAEQRAVLKYADLALQRYTGLAQFGAAAQERLDQAVELQKKTAAATDVAAAALAQAKINLDLTRIAAPFEGRIGRTLVHPGALITANETVLASLVQRDPIEVYFSPPVADLPLIDAHRRKAALAVTVSLPHLLDRQLTGTLSFISNAADARTGTIAMRATIAAPPDAVRPGQFVRVHLRLPDDARVLLVPAEAVATIQDRHYVMVVGDDDRLTRRYVTLSQQPAGPDRVVVSGLKEGERVVVSGTRALRGGERVTTP